MSFKKAVKKTAKQVGKAAHAAVREAVIASERGQLKRMKLYFLLLYADGGAAAPKMKYLDSLLKEEKLSKPTQQRFREYQKAIALAVPEAELPAVLKEIDGVLDKKTLWNQAQLLHVLWTLIKLGCTGGGCSEAEQAVIDHVARRWEADPALLEEFHDTAGTLLSLERHREWVLSSGKTPEEIQRITEELDRSTASLTSQVQTTISEIDIA